MAIDTTADRLKPSTTATAAPIGTPVPADRSTWLLALRNHRFALIAIGYLAAISFIVAQQLIHTPWGLPGHRVAFWLTTLIAIRWATQQSFAATGVGASAAAAIIAISPAYALHCVAYLVCGFVIDLLAGARVVRRAPWLMVLAAPLLACVNLVVPFVRNAALTTVDAAFANMWFFAQGHLMWGVLAGLLGVPLGVGVRRLGRAILVHTQDHLR